MATASASHIDPALRRSLRAGLVARFDFAWVEVRRNRSGTRVTLSWSGMPLPRDVVSATVSRLNAAGVKAEAGVSFDPSGLVAVGSRIIPTKGVVQVVPEHVPLWSCGRYHRHAGEAFVEHVLGPAASSVGSTDSCGCWFGDDALTLERLVELCGDETVAQTLYSAAGKTWYEKEPDSLFADDETFAILDDAMAYAAQVLGLAPPPELCRRGLFETCPECSGTRFTGSQKAPAPLCQACDGTGVLSVS